MRSIAILFVLMVPSVLEAQHDSPKSAHGLSAPVEAGQAAFAAVAEIVALLEADPQTQWGAVSIDALVAHLRDMNALVLRTSVRTTKLPTGAQLDVSGDADAGDAAQLMVREHAKLLDVLPMWRAVVEDIPGGIRLTVLARDPADVRTIQRIGALGFYGMMATGAHHQSHHLALARGASDAHRHTAP